MPEYENNLYAKRFTYVTDVVHKPRVRIYSGLSKVNVNLWAIRTRNPKPSQKWGVTVLNKHFINILLREHRSSGFHMLISNLTGERVLPSPVGPLVKRSA